MTTELKNAMAVYEDARVQYRKAVLASLHGQSNGDAIRAAIRAFQDARGELIRLGGLPGIETPVPTAARRSRETSGAGAWGFMRRLLPVG